MKTSLKEPERELPKDWTGLRICLHYTGGVGDVLMGVGGTAQALKSRDCEITASVMPHQGPLMELLPAIDFVEETQKLNNPHVRCKFDVMIDFSGAVANSRQIREGEYYKLFSEHVGIPIGPAKLSVQSSAQLKFGRKVVAIHPGASNPNRRWPEARFKVVADSLIAAGYCVLWLGTGDEFGYTHQYAEKASDESDALPVQVSMLSKCHYFIGNDSGFAHVAGLLGIPGIVLFSVTHPNDVIKAYPSLYGVHSFDSDLGLIPTRSLKADDEIGFKCLSGIAVEQVLKALPFQVKIASNLEGTYAPVKPTFIVCGDICRVTEELGSYFDFKTYGEYNDPSVPTTGVIRTEEDFIYVTTTFRTAIVAWDHPEVMRRAVREILN
jgi:ADP-heptose:LPS heptosyltransferase